MTTNLKMIVLVPLLKKNKRTLRMYLPKTREPSSLSHPRKENLHQNSIRKLLYQPNPCPKCNFPSLMVPTQKFGGIIVNLL
jgi:hypothetical protein